MFSLTLSNVHITLFLQREPLKSLCSGPFYRVVPEQPAKPQCGVRLDTSSQLPKSLSVQHRNVGCQAVTQQCHVSPLTHILHPAGSITLYFCHTAQCPVLYSNNRSLNDKKFNRVFCWNLIEYRFLQE